MTDEISRALEVLNFYRNQHYNEPSGTPEYELAQAINAVLPQLAVADHTAKRKKGAR